MKAIPFTKVLKRFGQTKKSKRTVLAKTLLANLNVKNGAVREDEVNEYFDIYFPKPKPQFTPEQLQRIQKSADRVINRGKAK